MPSRTPPTNASAPEVLLALAKDVRYIQLCQSLLEDVLNWKNNHDMTLCVASILYATTVVLRTGRTLGMEACGLSFRGNENGSGTGAATSAGISLTTLAQKYKRWHSWSAFVLSALWMHAMKRWATTSSNNNTSNPQNLRIPRPAGANNNAIGNNNNDGWFSRRNIAAQNNSNNNNRTTTLSNFSTGTTWLSAEDRDSEEERLRGDARRRFHQQQRQAMLDRAALAAHQEESARAGRIINANHNPNPQPQQYQMFTERWRQKLKDQVKSLIQALSIPRGPHVIADPNYNDGTYETTLWMWLIKLHLAWFVLNSGGGESQKYGKYPTWMHRLWKLSMVSNDDDGPSRVAERPASVRVVGMLIFVQGTATLLRTLTIRTVEFWMKRQQQSRLQRRREVGEQAQQYRLSSFFGKFFGRSTLLSSLSSSSQEVPRVMHAQVLEEEEEEDGDEMTSVMTTRTSNITTTSSSSVVTCGICSNKRTHAAASVKCGHVFCWKCLYHWVSSVRPECPLCRSSCRPQDLIALHHYTPAAPTEHS